jgi:hypothetical protein
LCVISVTINIVPVQNNSYVFNEHSRLASGLIYLQFGDYAYFHVNPPLAAMVGAMPSFIGQTNCPTLGDLGIDQFTRKESLAGSVWLKKNPDHLRWVIYGRYCMIIFIVTGTIFCYIYSYYYFGYISAIMATLLWIFSPYILGHGSLICPDVPSAAMGILAFFVFHRWLKCPEIFIAMLAGITLGLAELTKFTLLIFYPLYIFIAIVYRLPDLFFIKKIDLLKQCGQLIVIFIMSILVINMGYLFENTGQQLDKFRFQTMLFTGHKNLSDVPDNGGNRFKNSLIGKIPVLLPANFIQGIDTQRLDFETGMKSYLREKWSNRGWRYYYLYALFLKLPFGVILLFVSAIYCTIFISGINISLRDEMVIFLPAVVLFIFVSSQTGFSIHSRYIIPVLPFLFLWISKLGKLFLLRRYYLSIIVTILFLWSILSCLSIYPYCISYFNELSAVIPTSSKSRCPQELPDSSFIVTIINAGSRNGGRHLHDSNIDWGQDLFYLEKWIKKHPEIKEIHVAFYASYPIELTTIPVSKKSFHDNDFSGWFAISVNYLYDENKKYSYFLDKTPAARIGYSIYIYHIPNNCNQN